MSKTLVLITKDTQLRTVITKLEIVHDISGRFSVRLLQFVAVLNVTNFSSQLFVFCETSIFHLP